MILFLCICDWCLFYDGFMMRVKQEIHQIVLNYYLWTFSSFPFRSTTPANSQDFATDFIDSGYCNIPKEKKSMLFEKYILFQIISFKQMNCLHLMQFHPRFRRPDILDKKSIFL